LLDEFNSCPLYRMTHQRCEWHPVALWYGL